MSSSKQKTETRTLNKIIEIESENASPFLIYQKMYKECAQGWRSNEIMVNFFNFWEEKVDTEKYLFDKKMAEILNRPIKGLDINLATFKKLEKTGFMKCKHIVSETENSLRSAGFSKMAIRDIKEALWVYELKLAE